MGLYGVIRWETVAVGRWIEYVAECSGMPAVDMREDFYGENLNERKPPVRFL